MTRYVAPTGRNWPKYAVEGLAEKVAASLELQLGGSLEEVVATTGGEILFGAQAADDRDSGSIVANSLSDYTIYLSTNTSRQRDRFTIAHELGHLLIHLPPIKDADPSAVMRATRWVDDNNAAQQRAEWEANWFAAALLMPKDSFIQRWKSGGESEVQSVFDVSAAAAKTRAKSLGLT